MISLRYKWKDHTASNSIVTAQLILFKDRKITIIQLSIRRTKCYFKLIHSAYLFFGKFILIYYAILGYDPVKDDAILARYISIDID